MGFCGATIRCKRRRLLARLMIRRSRWYFASGWRDCHIPILRSNVLLITDISYLFFRPNLHRPKCLIAPCVGERFSKKSSGRIWTLAGLPEGRPRKVQLIFGQRIIRTTPGQFRTRVLTQAVVPTLHVDYKRSKIKQYHKEEQALRTETTINDTYDFKAGRLIKNLGQLRQIGFSTNRRLLNVQTLSHDCLIGEDRFQQLTQPIQVDE